MYSQSQKFMATLLLFCILLQSCGTGFKNIDLSPHREVPSREAIHQRPYQGQPPSRPQPSTPVPSASEEPLQPDAFPSIESTASGVNLTERATASASALPSPTSMGSSFDDCAASEVASQQPPRPSYLTSRQARPLSHKPGSCKRPSPTPFALTAFDGEQVLFSQQEDGAWYAQVKRLLPGGYTVSPLLRVVCAEGEDIEALLAALQGHDEWIQKKHVHVWPGAEHSGIVYLGRIGLLGGGNGQSSSRRRTRLCDMCRFPIVHMSSHSCPAYPFRPQPSSSRRPACTFRTATFQYAEKAKEIHRYLERNSTVTSQSEAMHVAWRLENYLRDLQKLSREARSLDFAAYSGQLSQLNSDLVRGLEQVLQEARDKSTEMWHIERANLKINDYNEELSTLYGFLGVTLRIESVSQAEKIQDQLRSSMMKLNQIAGSICSPLRSVSDAKCSEFEDRHQERIAILQKLDQELAESIRQLARSQQLKAELTRYQDRSQQIQDEFGERFTIESPAHAAALESQLQDHITYLNEVWSSMASTGFNTAAAREQVHKIHQTHIASLEQLCSDIKQGAQALAKAEQVKEVLQRYEGMMQTIDEEFSGARVESVEQAQQMQSSLQSHREALLALWAELASLSADAPGEEALAQFHIGYLGNLQRFYEELGKVAQDLAYTQHVGAEVARYETRMAEIREEVRTTKSIDRVEQAQQIKARLQEHIAYVSELWTGIEALREAPPEEPLRQFHAGNLGMLQELAAQVEASEQRLSHAAQVQAEVDRYKKRIQGIQTAFGKGVRITSLAQGQQVQARLQEDLAYLLGVWASIEKVSDGHPEEQLCQFHKTNVGMVQELHDDIAKSVLAMESQEREQRQLGRYQEVLDAVNQAFGSPLSINSAEQASEKAKSLQEHISSLESLGPIVPDHQERLEQLRDLHQSLEQQARSLAFHALATQQRQHVAAAFASINQLLQDGSPAQVLTEASSLRDELRAYQAALGAYSSLEQQAAQLDYLRANEENVTQLLDSYEQQHGAKQRDDQAGTSSSSSSALSALNDPQEAKKAVESYLAQWEAATPVSRKPMYQQGLGLLKAVETLKKQTKSSYRSGWSTFTDTDIAPFAWQQVGAAQQEKKKQALFDLRSLRDRLLSTLHPTPEELSSYGLRVAPSAPIADAEEKEAVVSIESSDDEQRYADETMRMHRAFVKSVGAVLQGKLIGLIDTLLDPLETMESYVQLLINIPELPNILADYIDELIDEEDAEKQAEMLGNLLTEAILLGLPSPKVAVVKQLQGVAKKLGQAADQAAKSARLLVKKLHLPIEGKIRFIPRPADVKNGKILRHGKGYEDKFGNVWRKDPSKNYLEWDVQLSRKGKAQLGHLSRSGNHINVSSAGKITH